MGYRGCFDHRSESQPVICNVDFQRRRTLQPPLNQRFRQRIFDILLQRPPQRPRTITAVPARFLEEPLARFRREHNLHLTVNQRVIGLADEQIDDAEQVFIAQRVEQNDLVQTIQELRIEHALHFAQHQFVQALGGALFARPTGIPWWTASAGGARRDSTS